MLIASPFCKFAHGIESVQRIPYYVEMATRNAIYGRPGATYLDVPDDIITGKCDVDKVVQVERAPDPPRMVAPIENIEAALNLLERAERPLVLIGRAWPGPAPRTKSAPSSSAPNCRSFVRRWGRA